MFLNMFLRDAADTFWLQNLTLTFFKSTYYAKVKVITTMTGLGDRNVFRIAVPQPVKLELNKKLDPKQMTIQAFNIDA